jgi:hypothetical protein
VDDKTALAGDTLVENSMASCESIEQPQVSFSLLGRSKRSSFFSYFDHFNNHDIVD